MERNFKKSNSTANMLNIPLPKPIDKPTSIEHFEYKCKQNDID